MIQAPIEDEIIATPLSHAAAIVRGRLTTQRVQGYWRSPTARMQFRIFFLLDGRKDHRRIGEILHLPEPAVREAIIQLVLEHLITMEVHERKNTLDVQLLHNSFVALKPNGRTFAKYFYDTLFAKGRTMLASNEIEQLFRRGASDTDMTERMEKQYTALLGALAFVVAGVLENKDITADLVALGQCHREKYHVKNAHYQLVGESLIETLQWYFGPNWTPELEKTWTQAYTLVSSLMMGKPGQAA